MSRYSWGADEHLFVEISEEMSLEANFKGMAIATVLRDAARTACSTCARPTRPSRSGSTPTCCARPTWRRRSKTSRTRRPTRRVPLDTRIVEIPVLYDDPWTHETLMRFRDRHQDPKATDIEYAAAINGYASVDEFIARIPARHGSSRWSASSPDCRSCIRWSSASGRSRCRNICARAPTRRS